MKKLLYIVVVTVCLLLFAGLTSQAGVQNVETDAPRWICWGPGVPDPCRNRLNDVEVTPGSGGDDVWTVGDAGTILHWDGQAWANIPSGTSAHLFGVAMVSNTKGWAVGSDGVILEWNGSDWTVLSPQSQDWYRAIAIIPGTAPTQAWAPGDRGGVGSFLHYDGVKWETKIGDYFPLFGGTLYDLSMLDNENGWAVGGKLGWSGMEGQLSQWDGERWQDRGAVNDQLHGVDMINANDGWAVGEEGSIYHWDGDSWTALDTAFEENLWGIDMLAANDGWAVGEEGTLAHWNGSEWTDHSSYLMRFGLRSVALASSNEGWAVGEGGVILHWNGSPWNAVVISTHRKLESVTMSPGSGGNDGWAVGNGRDLLHWDGTYWQPLQGTIGGYYAVAMANENDGWAAGWGGRFDHWDGNAWTAAPRVQSAKAMAMLSSSEGWAVGWGKIQRWDGANWTEVTSPTTKTLYGMDARTAGDIWAVGDNGAIIHFDGGSWQTVTSPVTDWLIDVSMPRADLGYIVGNNGTILRWNGASWTKLDRTPGFALRGVEVLDDGTGWAVGHEGQLWQLSGNEWLSVASPTRNDLYDIVLLSADDGWAVGESGVILRWTDKTPPPTATPAPTPAFLPLYLPMVVR
jgi:photosystem II stability/assembly factor-like uncharacterized protein